MKFLASHLSCTGGGSQNGDWTVSASNNASSCWAVADGLGGYFGGPEASRIACDAVVESFLKDSTVTTANMKRHIAAAQTAVLQRQSEALRLRQMRTTIVILLADETEAVWGHLGDSRLYRFRTGVLVEQTKDHSVSQSLVDAAVMTASDIRHHMDRSRLLRAVGEEEHPEAELLNKPLPLTRGDSFLLCTDGFWENVIEFEMEADLQRSDSPEEWLCKMESRLLERVTGSYDNFTAVAMIGT